MTHQWFSNTLISSTDVPDKGQGYQPKESILLVIFYIVFPLKVLFEEKIS